MNETKTTIDTSSVTQHKLYPVMNEYFTEIFREQPDLIKMQLSDICRLQCDLEARYGITYAEDDIINVMAAYSDEDVAGQYIIKRSDFYLPEVTFQLVNDDGKYYRKAPNNDIRPISNFIMTLLSTDFRDGKDYLNVSVTNTYGDTTEFPINSFDFVSVERFENTIGKHGNHWWGGDLGLLRQLYKSFRPVYSNGSEVHNA